MPFVNAADGTPIFYKDWGPKDAQPIVFHHGWPLSSDDWDAQMLFFLKNGYRVVAHDRRGHGRSAQVSDGQLQRACLARILVQRPLYILCDEPTSMLDPIATRDVMRLLIALAADGAGLAVVSHDRAVIDALAPEHLELRAHIAS